MKVELLARVFMAACKEALHALSDRNIIEFLVFAMIV